MLGSDGLHRVAEIRQEMPAIGHLDRGRGAEPRARGVTAGAVAHMTSGGPCSPNHAANCADERCQRSPGSHDRRRAETGFTDRPRFGDCRHLGRDNCSLCEIVN